MMLAAGVPITDLTAWYGQDPNYAPQVTVCCGGEPCAGSDRWGN